MGNWREQAACAGLDPETWFPDGTDVATITTAQSICGRCDVATACLEWARSHDQRAGIWGGKNLEHRVRYRPRAKAADRGSGPA